MSKKISKILGVILLSLFGLILVLLIGVQIFLNSQMMKDLVTDIASEYVDGQLSFSKQKASIFKHFPNVTISLDNFSLTYPHDRFADMQKGEAVPVLTQSGRSEEADTLASFDNLMVSINCLKALDGCYQFPKAKLTGARMHIHFYDTLCSNLDILRIPESEKEEKGGSPHFVLKKIILDGHPEIICTSASDSIYARLKMDKAVFDGKFSTDITEESDLNLKIEKFHAEAGSSEAEASFLLDNFSLIQRGKQYNVEASAQANLQMKDRKEFVLPIYLNTEISFPYQDLNAFTFKNLQMNLAPITLKGEGEIKMKRDSTYIRAELEMSECKAEELVQLIGGSFMPNLLKLETDAKLYMTAICDGILIPSQKILPTLLFELAVPKADISYSDIDRKGTIEGVIEAESNDYGVLSVDVKNLKANLAGIYLEGSAGMEDVLGDDPLISIDAIGKSSLDTLMTFVPDSLGFEASGELEASLEGLMFLSDLNFYNFAGADLTGEIKSRRIKLDYHPKDINAYLDRARISLEPTNDKLDKQITLGGEIQALYADIDSLNATYGSETIIQGKNISAIAQNAASTNSEEFGAEYHPIIAQLSAEVLSATDQGHTYAGLENSTNTFKFSNKLEGEIKIPILTARSNNQKIMLRQGQGRVGISNAGFDVSVLMYQEKDNKKEALAHYIEDWKMKGSMKIGEGVMVTPYFPIRNSISQVTGKFDNDEICLDHITIKSGSSDLDAKGKISNIKEAIVNDGLLKMDMDITSNRINLNELAAAFEAGSRFVAQGKDLAMNEEISDEEFISEVTIDTLQTDSIQNVLFLIPKNIDAKLNINANQIDYSDLQTTWLASEIAIRDQCLQITNTLATSNMGDIYFEGFYSSPSRDNLRAGFDLNMASITADKVVTLFPAIDSLMPMLTAFKGVLDCEMAAISDLDTNLNIRTNTINGVMRIKGKDLSLDNVGPMKKLAKTLMFKNKKTGMIDDMSVEGLIQNNEIQIFPFAMKIDRYQLAASGIQQFDQNFNYHVSVLKSPVPFRFGIDLKGNFDDWGFNVGKAKYKSTNVPVFTRQLNSIQMNLVNSIHQIFTKGVDRAVRQTEEDSQAIEEKKKEIGLDLNAPAEDLSTEELLIMEEALSENKTEQENTK